jgi:molecular chaperone DnaK (HSP70)
MSDPLGLSIGTTNLVAVRVGNQPVTHRAAVTLGDGSVLDGFVERVGDPVPLVAPDGVPHQADRLLVEALGDVVDATGEQDPTEIAIAVPAHWGMATLRSLRNALRADPTLSPNGMPARLVSDAITALTALQTNPGLPAQGVIALLDFGGGGTSITLADAAASFEPIDETTRYTDFAGDQIELPQVLFRSS